MGVQSFSDTTLLTLGRIHTSAGAVETFRSARKAGFENISIDLMYGIPGQTLKDWSEDLKRIENMTPEHISCYELSVEKGTPISESISRGELSKPDEGICRDMYFTADEILTGYGYFHYEVSNYARGKNFISRHNSAYWDRTPYIGLGPSAHSFNGKSTRSWNVASVEEYLRRMKNGNSAETGREEIGIEQVVLETVMLGMRCSTGIDLGEIKTETGIVINRNYLNDMIKNNKAVLSGTRLVPTAEGMLYADGDSINLIG
jgi:oxygen-independent coproporphyrinogen-3 oxidase